MSLSASPSTIPAAVAGMSSANPVERSGPGSARSLAELRVGERAVVFEAQVNADGAAVLRAMGLRPSAHVRVCRTGEPCIVEIGSACGMSCRIGLARALAERVLISSPNGEKA